MINSGPSSPTSALPRLAFRVPEAYPGTPLFSPLISSPASLSPAVVNELAIVEPKESIEELIAPIALVTLEAAASIAAMIGLLSNLIARIAAIVSSCLPVMLITPESM